MLTSAAVRGGVLTAAMTYGDLDRAHRRSQLVWAPGRSAGWVLDERPDVQLLQPV